ncbi:MAG: ArgE/DapE family deacylase [Anaerolineae bacterium]
MNSPFDPAINAEETIGLLCDLIAIDSVNPSLVPGGAGEGEIARYVADYLSHLGLEVRHWEVAPGRPNVVGRLKGSGGGKTLMLNCHMDTVSVEGMDEPFQARRVNGKIYGRGALDIKGGLAAVLTAVKAVVESGVTLTGDLLVAAVADEEYASLGTESLTKEYRADGAIVMEPTDLRLGVAHKGFVWLEVQTFGKAAHGSRPAEGVDAIMKMGLFLARLAELEQRLWSGPGHPLLGPGSLHASIIEGGRELSTYPDHCRLQIERRTVPGETVEGVAQEVREIMADLEKSDSDFKATSRVTFVREPWEASPDQEIIQVLRQAIAAQSGQEPSYTVHSAWMDSALLGAAGISTVVFGPGGEGAHALEEYVRADEVVACADILARTIVDFCVLVQ